MRPTRPRPVAFHDDAPRPGRRMFADGSVPPVLRTAFDVSAYTREVGGRLELDASVLAHEVHALGADGAAALAEIRRDLAYLHRVESAALTEARTMLSSWTAHEARITAFLASWLWEGFWEARALREVAGALPSGPAAPPERPRPGSRVRRRYVEHLLPLAGPAWSLVAAERVTAGHMARMAIREASLLAALRALAPRLDLVPTARHTLGEIAARRERSVDFFRREAIARITRSRGEAVVARIVLAVGGDPLRPAGQAVAHERDARSSIFRTPEDRRTLQAASFEITRLLPGPRPRPVRTVPGGRRGVRS